MMAYAVGGLGGQFVYFVPSMQPCMKYESNFINDLTKNNL